VDREAFVGRLRKWLADKGIERWYLDAMGVEGDPRPRRRWAHKGIKIRATKNRDHIRMDVTGLICPRKGQFYALKFTHTDKEVIQSFLDDVDVDVQLTRPRNLLILDNASWHKGCSINWGRFEPAFPLGLFS
jgi:hypothetical protein